MKYEELKKANKLFGTNEKRDPMYKVATFLIKTHWGNPKEITDGLGVLLLTWNQAFYRYKSFEFDELQKVIEKYFTQIENYRKRSIFTFKSSDESEIQNIFHEFLEALSILRKTGIARSPVAVSKALHLLAPDFFPLLDDEIAKGYNCKWKNPVVPLQASELYIKFMKININELQKILKDYSIKNKVREKQALKEICESCSKDFPYTKTILKLFDEYNYAKYTKGWIA